MNKRAFLFGINGYNKPIAPLKYARQDAEAVAEALRDGYDFQESEIVLRTCAMESQLPTKYEILSTLESWTYPLDLLILGFWGHGILYDKERFLCPVGTNLQYLRETALTLVELRDAIRKIPAKNVCVILDCCQNQLQTARGTADPLEPGARDIILNAFRPDPVFTKIPAQTVAVLNSCSEGQRAYEWDEKRHGYFTYHLLKQLRKREPNLSTIFAQVKTDTRNSLPNCQEPFWECTGAPTITLPAVQLNPPVVPDNPNDVIIVTNHEIGEINVTVRRVDLPQSAQPQTLPAIPEDLRQFQSELAGIEQAIQQLKDGTHSALDPAKKAISDAKSQLEALSAKRDGAWKLLNNEKLRTTVMEAFRKSPYASVVEFFKFAPNRDDQPQLSEAILWERHVFQAQAESDRVEKEYRNRCQSEIDKLEKLKTESQKRISSRIAAFQTEVLTKVLSTFRNYNILSAAIDDWDCRHKLPKLLEYNLGWEFAKLWTRAVELWNERPVIVQERERKKREAAEAQRRAVRRKWTIRGIVAGLLLGITIGAMVLDACIETEAERIAAASKLQKETAPNGEIRMVKTIDGVEYAFVWCPPGSFKMGGESWSDSSKPVHTVTLSKGFWMLKTEVTQEMWKSVMGENPSNWKGDKLPVENVSWKMCDDFCAKLREKGLDVSLPTEAQWEYACRAGSTGDYAGNFDEMGWYTSNSGSKTHEVGLKEPNAWGLYDMHGNVLEWCQDWYDSGYYAKSPASDPTGPEEDCSYRVYRGGGWGRVAGICRSADRCGSSPDYRRNYLGLRLVCGIQSSQGK